MARKQTVEVETRSAVIYCRISKDEGTGLGLEDQERRCKAYCEANNLEILDICTDDGVSASTIDRPELNRAISLLSPGTMLLSLKLDRLTRSVATYPELNERIEAQGGNWGTVVEKFDTGSAVGRLMLNMLLSVAQFEREQTIERTKAALHTKKLRGERLGATPLGFTTLEDKTVVENATEQAAIIRAKELRGEGKSLRQIATILTQEGHRTKRGGSWLAESVKRAVGE